MQIGVRWYWVATCVLFLGSVGCEGKIATKDASGDGDNSCLSNRQFFVRKLWPGILGTTCTSCHTPDGIAVEQGARFSLLPDSYPGFVESNMSTLDEMIHTEYQGEPMLLAKPTGLVSHGGGALLADDSEGRALLSEWVERVEEDPCPNSKSSLSLTGVELLSPQATFRKASLHLVGQLPTEEQIQRLEDEGEGALDSMIRTLTRKNAFYLRVVELLNDVFLTDRYFPRSNAVDLLDEEYYPLAGEWYDQLDENVRQRVNQSLAREPLELVSYVLRNDLPFSDILQAPYTVVNPYTAQLYGVDVDFDNDKNVDEWKPARVSVFVDGSKEELPHAGVLTNPMWLNRFPTTETNRNRHRSRMVMKQFLATDVLRVAERPIDPQTATQFNNPTRDDPSCIGCHRQIDPIAGAFMNWSYRDMEEYLPGSEWYPEMFAPGFGVEKMPVAKYTEPEQWLASRLVQDPRFALAVVHLFYRALTGHEPLPFPAIEDQGADDYEAALDAWALQDENFRTIAAKFLEKDYDARVVISQIIRGPYFRGYALAGDAVIADGVLADIGTGRLLHPEALNRKLEALTGVPWTRGWDREPYLLSDYSILYGGIDSDSVTTRLTDPNGVMAAVQWRMANEVACRVTAWEFSLPRKDRLLFPKVEATDVPRDESGANAEAEKKVRDNMVHLHKHLLGDNVAQDSERIERAMALWNDTWESGVLAVATDAESRQLPWSCRARTNPLTGEDLPEAQQFNEDATYTVRSWMAALTYLLSDYEFLFE